MHLLLRKSPTDGLHWTTSNYFLPFSWANEMIRSPRRPPFACRPVHQPPLLQPGAARRWHKPLCQPRGFPTAQYEGSEGRPPGFTGWWRPGRGIFLVLNVLGCARTSATHTRAAAGTLRQTHGWAAGVANTRKNAFFPPLRSQVWCYAAGGDLLARIAECISPLPSVGCRCRAGLRARRLPSPLLLPASAGVAAMESPSPARPRVVYIPRCLCAVRSPASSRAWGTLTPLAWAEQKVAEVCTLISTRAIITALTSNTPGSAATLRAWLP